MGDSERLNQMSEINAILGAIRSLTKTSDEEIGQAHEQFLAAAAKKGFTPPSQGA